MHTYSTDNDLRPKVYAYLAVLSFILAVIIANITNTIIDFLPDSPTLSILFGVPSWVLIFAIIAKGFNQWGWKTDIVRRLGLVEVPDLNGDWEGWVTETRSDFPSRHDNMKIRAEMNIRQTWRKIVVDFETKNSESISIGATMLTKQSAQATLIHHYKNEPKPSKAERLDMHYGTSNLRLKKEHSNDENKIILTGFHYTGPQRETNGESWFKRESR